VGFLVSPQGGNIPTVDRSRSLSRHLGSGSWITFPSSPEQQDGRLVWLVRPDGHRWHTPTEAVQAAINNDTSPHVAHADASTERNPDIPFGASMHEPTAHRS
jgi:hypothetical protein